MDLQKISDQLQKREMDRKEFIASVGAAALTLVGVGSVLKAFNLKSSGVHHASGYGSSPYGGNTNTKAS